MYGFYSSILGEVGLEVNGARTQSSLFQGSHATTNARGCLNIRGAVFPPLSEKIRASPLPIMTFRAGNYPTQCPSTLKFNTEIRCVVKRPEKALIFSAV